MKRRKTLEQAVFDAVEREQKRFASELHDGICQELAGVAMMLDVILPRVASDVAAEIRSVSEHIRRVTLDARKLALGLAPIAVERAGLAGALALLKLDVETLKDIGSESWGLGIRSMASRAEWLGGELRLLPGTVRGTRVQVIVPMGYGL